MYKSPVSWFEIPAVDLDRAARFYGELIGAQLQVLSGERRPMAVFPYEPPAVGGCLVSSPESKPSADGALIYLDTRGELDAFLARVPAAGGKVLVPRTSIGPHGWFAIVRDTEGNSIGLHEEARASSS